MMEKLLECSTLDHKMIAGSNLARGILFYLLFTNLPAVCQNSPSDALRVSCHIAKPLYIQ